MHLQKLLTYYHNKIQYFILYNINQIHQSFHSFTSLKTIFYYYLQIIIQSKSFATYTINNTSQFQMLPKLHQKHLSLYKKQTVATGDLSPISYLIKNCLLTTKTNQMEKNQTTLLLKSTLNGAFHKDNFIWGGAMNICWKTLSDQIIKEPLQLKVKDELAIHMVKNFNNSKFSTKDLDEKSYYTKAGFGQETVSAINKECRAKFPKKEFADLQIQLNPRDIISYAYFVKEVQYLNPFVNEPSFHFNGKTVEGFIAKTPQQYSNIRVCKYQNEDSFMLKLLLKQQGQELFIIKGSQGILPQDIVAEVQKDWNVVDKPSKQEKFGMPKVKLDINRKYKQLVGADVANKNFPDYFISQMFENIKFRIDEVGAKVENQAVIAMKCKMALKEQPTRRFIVDKPFWIVMKQKGAHPYFMVQINNTEFMKESAR